MPQGFHDLVKRVRAEDPFSTRTAPNTTSDIWDSFTYYVFLDHNRTDAEASYLYDVLEDSGVLSMDQVQQLRGTWSNRAHSIASIALKKAPAGRKVSALNDLITNINDSEHCILDGNRYFRKHGVTGKWIVSRTRTKADVDNLLWEWGWNDYQKNPDHIWRFGLTKGILLLNSLGLAIDYCPPSRQIKRFVEEDLGRQPVKQPTSSPSSQTSSLWSWTSDYTAIRAVQSVTANITVQTNGATTADVGHAIWYWKGAQSLLAFARGGLKRKFTPSRFLDFLHSKRWRLPDFASELCDIDGVDPLSTDLRSYVSSVP